jgi:hypothetical protein
VADHAPIGGCRGPFLGLRLPPDLTLTKRGAVWGMGAGGWGDKHLWGDPHRWTSVDTSVDFFLCDVGHFSKGNGSSFPNVVPGTTEKKNRDGTEPSG